MDPHLQDSGMYLDPSKGSASALPLSHPAYVRCEEQYAAHPVGLEMKSAEEFRSSSSMTPTPQVKPPCRRRFRLASLASS